MMLTIHGLPISVKYHDLKVLIKEKCNISDYILDNLVSEGDGTKKVRIGLADEREGSHLIKCLDGLRMSGNILRVVPVGKPPATPSSNFDQRSGYPQHNDYPNQPGPNYGNQSINGLGRLEPMGRPERVIRPEPARSEPWNQGPTSVNQWSANQPGNQPLQQPMQQTFNYQQPQINPSFGLGQQAAASSQKPDMRQFDQREMFQGRMSTQEQGYGFPPKNIIPDPTRRGDARSHVLRSVEIIDEPLNRPILQPSRYPAPSFDAQQKPITIMKDNFQGPQYNLDRSGQLPYQGQPGHSTQGQPVPHQMPGQQPSPWIQPQVQQDKTPFAKTPAPFMKRYPEPDRRQTLPKSVAESPRNIIEGYNKPGPRFSPRRDIDGTVIRGNSPGRRMPSPGRRMPSPGRRMPSPGNRIPSQGHRMPSPGRRMPSPGRRMPSPGHRMPSPGHRMPSPGRRMPSPGRRMPSPGRRMPSPGRRMPSPGRRMPSPGRRMPSPGRRMPSPGRRMPSPGRRMPSPGRRMPSPGRRMSPGDRRMQRRSPGRRESPTRRLASPTLKRNSPARYSPSHRLLDKPLDKYGGNDPRSLKDVRPAYDMPAQAPNQAMYSGGYRPNVHENVQYPIPGLRQSERSSPWQQGKTVFAGTKKDDERRDVPRMPKFEPRIDSDTKRSPRKSRSPMRRDRSPQRDRFKKHSPSPRSPRRSWALEKRRSPEIREAPPPPVWPGQSNQGEDQYRRFPDRNEGPKRMPVWEPRRPEDERRYDEQPRGRPDLAGRGHGYKPDDRFAPREPKFEPRDIKFDQREPKFEPRESKFESREPKFEMREPKFEPHGPKFESREPKFESREPKFESREPKFEPRDLKFKAREPKFEPREEFRQSDDMQKRFDREFREPQRPNEVIHHQSRHSDRREGFSREDFGRREEDRKIPKVPETFNKELDDVYKRAVEFNKRAEELRKREERRREEFEPRRDDRAPKDFERKFDHHDVRDETRHDDRNREEFKRTPEWKTDERRNNMSPTRKAKREKAIEEIASKILNKHGKHFSGDVKTRILEELKLTVGKVMQDMFGYEDMSFIEMVVKFNARFSVKDEVKMFEDVISSLPSHYRSLKRPANEPQSHGSTEIPAKTARRDPEPHVNRDASAKANEQHIPEWTSNFQSSTIQLQNAMFMSQFDMVSRMPMIMQQPLMVPAPNYQLQMQEPKPPPVNYQLQMQEPKPPPQSQANPNHFQAPHPMFEPSSEEGHHLYLCKDDFEQYTENQAEYLKKFLVSQILCASENGQGWSPDFTVKGLQSIFRYELLARDEATKDWLQNLDFSEFSLFNVLVYTKEELWYERAAVWLPGHSRCRNIEPLTKLKLQNKKLEGVNIGKWKFVKKIVTSKGTRIYVDMPPSSARALEKQKMLLSYELQKVSVFLKAVAVDKEVFDSGLREMSVKDPAEIIAATQNSPMPSLGHEPSIIKICLKGNKALSVAQARKVKEMIIYHIFKYHQDYGNNSGRTDFIKFGFCLPGYFGVIPENPESKRWLLSLNIGKLNRHAVVVLGADESSTKFIQMTIVLKREQTLNTALVQERLRQSNQGVKGLNFALWKPLKVSHTRHRTMFDVDMDLESVETIMKMKYKLDYVDDRHIQHTAQVKYEHSGSRLEEVVKKLKSEMNDSYDVANMDLASSDEDDDIVCLGEVK